MPSQGARHGREARIRRHDQRSHAPVAAAVYRSDSAEASRKGSLPHQPLAAGPDGAVADGKPDAVEAQILEVQGLGLSAGQYPKRKQAPRGACLVFGSPIMAMMVVPVVAMPVMAIAADPARTVIGQDNPAAR